MFMYRYNVHIQPENVNPNILFDLRMCQRLFNPRFSERSGEKRRVETFVGRLCAI
jgi:hypothetical protein